MDMHEEGQEDQGPGRRERPGGRPLIPGDPILPGDPRDPWAPAHIFTMLEAPGSAVMSSQRGTFNAFHAFNAFR